jgi:alanine racemase
MDRTTHAKDRAGVNDSRLLISRNALLHNVRLIRRALSTDAKICAVVKADAYGHGAAIVVDALANFALDDMDAPAVDALAVATFDEAAAIPDNDLPVLVLRPVENVFVSRHREALEHAIRSGWHLTVISPAAAEDVNRVAMSCGMRASVQVMLDTGLTRCGAPLDSLDELVAKIESRSGLKLAGIATHFANSDARGDDYTAEQLRRFRDATDPLAASRKLLRHVANSGGLFFWPDTHFDMVRPGVSIYGIDPTVRPNLTRALRPAMKWLAPLIAVHDVKRGTTVGYGQTWTAPHHTRVGIVSVGYADGYMRCFSNRAVMMYDRRPVPVVGRVSMDYTAIDLGHDSPARVGDEVVVLDNDPLSPASAYALAELAETIPYELFTRLGPRVKRVAVDPHDALVASESAVD